jgi:hypothetical protein
VRRFTALMTQTNGLQRRLVPRKREQAMSASEKVENRFGRPLVAGRRGQARMFERRGFRGSGSCLRLMLTSVVDPKRL